jgi:hypothetical protein
MVAARVAGTMLKVGVQTLIMGVGSVAELQRMEDNHSAVLPLLELSRSTRK